MLKRAIRIIQLILFVFLPSMPTAGAAAKTIYVDARATGANDGSSWAEACLCLQDALAVTQSGDEIRVAQGIYKPDQRLVVSRFGSAVEGSGDRTATFQLINGVAIKGGYAGCGEPDPHTRDVRLYETILSGDLNGDDGPDFGNNAENSYHVVTGSGTNETAALDGFTVTAGNANGSSPNQKGGGMDNYSGSPTVVNCTFCENSATSGGGMSNGQNSGPTVSDCTFSSNRAADNGGGMRNNSSSPTVFNCTFSGNSAKNGGGMNNRSGSPSVTNCTFTGNSATNNGGGMRNQYDSRPSLTNCTFGGNSAESGGGLHNSNNSSPTTMDCTFSSNSAADKGGGMFNNNSRPMVIICTFSGNHSDSGGAMYNDNSNPVLTDCTFSGNSAEKGGGAMNNWQSSPTLTNCTFSYNSAGWGGGAIGNVSWDEYTESSPIVTNCTFIGNSAGWDGGGMSNVSSHPTLINCVFSENSAKEGGGGMHNDAGNPTLLNCMFSGNLAEKDGGGMVNYSGSRPTLTNCTFSGNSARGDGGGISNFYDSNPILSNCIVWGNTAQDNSQIHEDHTSLVIITYSDVQGGWPGRGNINADPYFASPGYWIAASPRTGGHDVWVAGDYHLKSQTGRWDPNSESWVVDDVTSPCIDAGDPNSDWTGETWPHGGRINMGAYGGTCEASMSTKPEVMSLPRVAYIYKSDSQAAGGFRSLLVGYGCPTTLIGLEDVATAALDSYDLIVVASDTGYSRTWRDAQTVAPIDRTGKPILGLGEGGYDFFGQLELSIGRPNGAHGDGGSIYAVDQNHVLFGAPYPIDIPEDGVMQLYTATSHVILYLWSVPETVTVLAGLAGNPGYYPLALQHDRYVFWGFTESPHKMTDIGKTLFINLVVRAANAAW